MWDSWMSAKFSDSSAFTTLLASRFIEFSPAHWADRRLAPPYQRRLARPGECGCTRSEKTSIPSTPLKSVAGSPRIQRSSRSTRS